MFSVRRILGFVLWLAIVTALAGCAGSNMGAGNTPEAVYHPKFPLGIKTLKDARKDLASLLENRKDALLIDFFSTYCKQHGLQDLTTTKAGFHEIEKGNSGACSISFAPPPSPMVWVHDLKNIYVRTDMLKVTSRLFVLYADLPCLPIKVDAAADGYYAIYVGQDQIGLYLPSEKNAQRVADDLFFIQQHYQRDYQEHLALFEARAAKSRKLAVKPPLSEEQRKYIVQANYLTRQKDYDGAIDMYRKLIDLDPVSYPGAYFNLALLNAQLYRIGPAIGYMKQYLSLVPAAKDARSAQDKIYEWELKLPCPQASVSSQAGGGYLGVTIQSAAEMPGESSGPGEGKGVRVLEVTKGSPADRAGLERDDIIVLFDGKQINASSDLPGLVASAPGKTVDVEIYRNGRDRTVKVDIGKLPN